MKKFPVSRMAQAALLSLSAAMITFALAAPYFTPSQRTIMFSEGFGFYRIRGTVVTIGIIAGVSLLLGWALSSLFRKRVGRGRWASFAILASVPLSVAVAVPQAMESLPYITGNVSVTEAVVQLSPREGRHALTPEDIAEFRKQTEKRLASHEVWILEWIQPAPDQVKMTLSGKNIPSALRSVMASGQLDFYETHEFNKGFGALEEMERVIIERMKAGKIPPNAFMLANGDPDSAYLALLPNMAVETDTAPDYLHQPSEESSLEERRLRFQLAHPLIGMMTIMPAEQINPLHPLMGYVQEKDTALFASYLREPSVAAVTPVDTRMLFSASRSEVFTEDAGHYYELIAIKPTRGGQRLTGHDVTSARMDFDNRQPVVSIKFNNEGAQAWEVMTRNNIDHCIAIVMDGMVFSYPNVQGAIKGGNSQITGNFTVAEANDLAHMIDSGTLKVQARILSVTEID